LSAPKGGRVLLFGLDNRPITLEESGEIVLRGLSILGIFISRNTLPRAVSLLSKHAEAFSPIVTDVYPLSEWKSAFDRLLSGGADGKILVQPDRNPMALRRSDKGSAT
jgi:threonine dehydrogenase-like Zn-dependent dehydrogenase